MKNGKAFWKVFKIGYDFIDLIRYYIVVILFSSIIIVSFVNVIFRYVPWFKSITWADEFCRYTNVWIIFLGASIAFKYGSHLMMNFLIKLLSEKYRILITKITYIMILIFLALFIIFGTQRTIQNIVQLAQDLPVSMALFYLAIPIGSLYMFIDGLLILLYGHHPFLKNKTKQEV